MGMYNEVYKSCYNCGARCTLQIPQVVLGFGCFNLDMPDSENIQELSQGQKEELARYVNDDNFYCGHDACNSAFTVRIVVGGRGETVVTI